ncbi:MAG: hypothetical protein DBX59_03990 [Bacillota bacterium]|nr:MAG: hypothetical protein DBX59_03990 [Bacillota bacterium]
MKNAVKKALCLATAVALSVSALTACNGRGKSKEVNFWIYGTDSQLEMYYQLTTAFNETYGAEHGISVKATEVLSAGYMGTVTNLMGSSTAPDVILAEDADYKKWIIGNYITDISDINSIYTDIDLGEISNAVIDRLHYDVETNTSDPDDPLYAMPLESRPTALYYNKGLMEKAGIIVISVDEDKLDAWNRNEIADNYGKKKSDYAKLANVTVPAKGYYRSRNPYYFDELSEGWVKPDVAGGEIMVFNNRIAMNWDEVEDLGMYFSAAWNPGKNGRSEWGTTYGYFTETWFNYGWTVGGDCLYDLTGDGDWNFGLLDPNPNYIVKEGKTFTGRTGTVYQAGETVAFYDKMNADANETLVPDSYGDYNRANGGKAGIWTVIQEEMNKGEDSALIELPSTRTAFKRYLKLGCGNDTSNANNLVEDSYGLNISPNPANITDINPIYKQFYSGDILCFVGESQLMREIAVYADDYKLSWDVAPLVQYKEYQDPSDPDCDEVKAKGVVAGHSRVAAMGINRLSSKMDEAKAFVKWATGLDGQRVRASIGFFPTQESLMGELKFDSDSAPTNVTAFSEAMKYQRPGDWWYMPDTLWVEAWCVDLNTNVRNGKKSFANWYSPAVTATNAKLKDYKDFDR